MSTVDETSATLENEAAEVSSSLPEGVMTSISLARKLAEEDGRTIDDTWDDGQAKWWDYGTYGGLLLFVATIWLGGGVGYQMWVPVVAAAVIAVAWWLIGRRAMDTDSLAQTWAYLLIAFAATIVVSAIVGMGPLILMVVYTHVWSLIRSLHVAVITLVLVTTAATVARWGYLGWDSEVLRHIAPQMAMILVFTLGIGFFINYVIGQADKNALLVRDLKAAQEQLAAVQHEAGVTAERERVSREIHDTLAQGFMSVVTLSQVAQRSLTKGNTDAVAERLALMESTARENLAEARSLVAAYAPVSLQGATLAEALTRQVDKWTAETGIESAVTVDPDLPELPSSTEVALLRAAQEALTNVRRHAKANAVSVALRGDDAAVTLTVADDGVGLAEDQREGYGLSGMRDRVGAVGGEVTVKPTAAGRGTTVVVRIPT